jgi:outer membrane phospholipase A
MNMGLMAWGGMVVLALVVTARAEIIYGLQPRAPVFTAGAVAEVDLVATNEGAAASRMEAPASLPLMAVTLWGARAVVLRRATAVEGEGWVAAGAFRRVRYTVEVPRAARGVAVLAAEDPRFGRLAVEVVAPSGAVGAPAEDTGYAHADLPGEGGAQRGRETLRARRPLGVMAHDPVYFALGAHRGLNARFQISLKFRPLGPADDRVDVVGSFWGNVYGAFTQTSLWDLESESRPFYDTSYKPSLFYRRASINVAVWGARLGHAAGYEHESNGQAGALSRSLDTLFVQPRLTWTGADGVEWGYAPKVLFYLEKSENADLPRYRGYVDHDLWCEDPDGWKVAARLRLGSGGRGSVLVDISYPTRKVFGLVSDTPWAHGYLHLQGFSGYTESLRTYDQRLPWQARLGFMLVR